MKRWLQIASVLILLPFIGKILFLETGLLAQSMYRLSMVCHCNHGSKNEIHRNEDSPTPTRITCHLTKNSGQHQCSCAKKKSATKVLQSQLMNPSFTSETKFHQTMQLIKTTFFTISNVNLSNGYSHLPEKPPRFKTS
ncbi:hypothetical protein EHQ16_04450 [Leptospira kanakyensis]|uniref:Uncharacterized protein n=1 Tax=Leptospira kanakyensis TaxID=2484968 RepID=A0A6N4PYF0_9LEPT|nr:hypothetical protein [Leptospira kanakyensis]TGK50698.1 hypothetical protein EHQ11_13570 [Leptospira kanakyensis]TGK63701.1 hypothetical protein EHQ16_04450 [Leptospira kanakyensis]TGK69835.1 hypothetical protein EHQ18_13730 [Leptospira kanakyensis]